jgi:hypothetical protein
MRQNRITYKTAFFFLFFLINIIGLRNRIFMYWKFIWRIRLLIFFIIVLILFFSWRNKLLVELENEVTYFRLLLIVNNSLTTTTRWIISIFVFIEALNINSIGRLYSIVCLTMATSTSSYPQNTSSCQVLTWRGQTIALISWIRSTFLCGICCFKTSFLPWRLFLLVVWIIICVTLY